MRSQKQDEVGAHAEDYKVVKYWCATWLCTRSVCVPLLFCQ